MDLDILVIVDASLAEQRTLSKTRSIFFVLLHIISDIWHSV